MIAAARLGGQPWASSGARSQNYLVGFSNKPPLHVVAEFIRNFSANTAGKVIFDAYDRFLTILGDQTKRDRLENLGAEDAGSDPVFTEARDVGTAFQDRLTELFFKTDAELSPRLTRARDSSIAASASNSI